MEVFKVWNKPEPLVINLFSGAGLRFQSHEQQSAVAPAATTSQEKMQYMYQKKDPTATSPVDHTELPSPCEDNRLELHVAAGSKKSASKTAGGPKGYNRDKRPSADYYPIHTEDYDTDFRLVNNLLGNQAPVTSKISFRSSRIDSIVFSFKISSILC